MNCAPTRKKSAGGFLVGGLTDMFCDGFGPFDNVRECTQHLDHAHDQDGVDETNLHPDRGFETSL